MKYVIIGNSAAAIGAVEGIRTADLEGEITIISEEPHHTYSRPLISYYLSGKVSEDKMLYRSKDFYQKYNVKAMLGVKAVAIDTTLKRVELENGEGVNFDKLLIATGGRPLMPVVKGQNKEGVFSFIKLDDVKAIEKVALPGKNAVIVGAGLIGLKAAEALAKRGVSVNVVELSNRVLSTILDDEAASLVQRHLAKHKINFHLNTTVSEVIGEERLTGVILQKGEVLNCDLLIMAVGVLPNTDIANGTDISVNRGVVIASDMQTNVKDIYAAGDVAEGYDMLFEMQRVLPILPNAYKQGEVAGLNMAGRTTFFEGGFAMNAIGFFNLPMVTAGLVNSQDEQYEQINTIDVERMSYQKVILKDNRLVGFIFLREVDRVGIYTRLLHEKVDLSSLKELLLQEGFGYAYFPERLTEDKILRGGKVNECDFI